MSVHSLKLFLCRIIRKACVIFHGSLHYIRIALLWLYSLLHLWSLRLMCSLLHLWLWFLLICLVQCIHTRLNCILHAVPYLLYLLLLRSRFVWLRVFTACAL